MNEILKKNILNRKIANSFTMERQILLNVILIADLDGGYVAQCPELGVTSQGETVEDALKNIKETSELYLESAEELGIMDEVLEKLGLTKKDLKKEMVVPKIISSNIPVKIGSLAY